MVIAHLLRFLLSIQVDVKEAYHVFDLFILTYTPFSLYVILEYKKTVNKNRLFFPGSSERFFDMMFDGDVFIHYLNREWNKPEKYVWYKWFNGCSVFG